MSNLFMLNRETTYPLDLMFGDPPGQEPQECPIAYVEWIRKTMMGAHAVVYEALGQAAMRKSKDYNSDIKHRRFEKGDWVLSITRQRQIRNLASPGMFHIWCWVSSLHGFTKSRRDRLMFQ